MKRKLLAIALWLAGIALSVLAEGGHIFGNAWSEQGWRNPQLGIPGVILCIAGAIIYPRKKR